MELKYADIAARGAALLDRERPGWVADIDQDNLDMQCCDHCILGQLYGHYWQGRHALNIVQGSPYGFSLTLAQMGDYDALADAWRAEIRKRLEAPLPAWARPDDGR